MTSSSLLLLRCFVNDFRHQVSTSSFMALSVSRAFRVEQKSRQTPAAWPGLHARLSHAAAQGPCCAPVGYRSGNRWRSRVSNSRAARFGSATSQSSTSGQLSANGSVRVRHQCSAAFFLRPSRAPGNRCAMRSRTRPDTPAGRGSLRRRFHDWKGSTTLVAPRECSSAAPPGRAAQIAPEDAL